MLLAFVGLNTTVTFAADKKLGNKINTGTKPSRAPACRPVCVFVNDQQTLELVHLFGRAQFSYYIYDETGCPVMAGSGEFDADGLFNVAIDTLPSGHYTVEVVINGSANLCSFYKM